MNKLVIGGYLNIIIAILHILCLYDSSLFFELTGVGENMRKNSEIHIMLPYLITIVVAIIFFVFGLYALSAAGKIKEMPFLKLGILSISCVYILRGLVGIVINVFVENIFLWYHLLFSIVALIIGLLYLMGWKGREIKN